MRATFQSVRWCRSIFGIAIRNDSLLIQRLNRRVCDYFICFAILNLNGSINILTICSACRPEPNHLPSGAFAWDMKLGSWTFNYVTFFCECSRVVIGKVFKQNVEQNIDNQPFENATNESNRSRIVIERIHCAIIASLFVCVSFFCVFKMNEHFLRASNIFCAKKKMFNHSTKQPLRIRE